MTKCDKGEGVKPKSDATTSKKFRFNNRIRMTLKFVITPFHLLFNVAFHVDNKVSVEKICDLNFASKAGSLSAQSSGLSQYLSGNKGGWGSRQTVTKCDKRGKGVKNRW